MHASKRCAAARRSRGETLPQALEQDTAALESRSAGRSRADLRACVAVRLRHDDDRPRARCVAQQGKPDMPFLTRDGARLWWRSDGDAAKPALLLANSLGTDLTLWDPILPQLLERFHVLRYDMRGHGASDATPGQYTIEALARDALAVADARRRVEVQLCGHLHWRDGRTMARCECRRAPRQARAVEHRRRSFRPISGPRASMR